jgi:hypothetical protein
MTQYAHQKIDRNNPFANIQMEWTNLDDGENLLLFFVPKRRASRSLGGRRAQRLVQTPRDDAAQSTLLS